MANQFETQLIRSMENDMYRGVNDFNKTINLWSPRPGMTLSVRPIEGPLTVTGQGVHVEVPLDYRYTFNVETYLKSPTVGGVEVYRWRIKNIEYIVPNFWARIKRFVSTAITRY